MGEPLADVNEIASVRLTKLIVLMVMRAFRLIIMHRTRTLEITHHAPRRITSELDAEIQPVDINLDVAPIARSSLFDVVVLTATRR